MNHSTKTQKGSTLVEYAFVLTGFLMLMFGVIDFGRALFAYHYVSSAARDAARWSMVNGYNCGGDSSCDTANGAGSTHGAFETAVQNYVTNRVPTSMRAADVTATASFLNNNGPTECNTGATKNYPGCTVKVQVSYAFHFTTPIVSRSALTLSSTSEMVIAH